MRLLTKRLVPRGNTVGLFRKQIVRIIFNRNARDGISLLNGIHHALAFRHLAEDGVLAIQPVRGHMGDEELGTVGAGARLQV